ncbi:MAG: hypothetical protein ABIL70_08835 [candidate division WOR-3 bacterium]
MKNKLVVVGMVFLLCLFVGCGKKTDEEELSNAENLVQGLALLGMMTNVDAFKNPQHLHTPPYWEGPSAFDVPEEWGDLYYRCIFKFPVDSAGTPIDSGHLYLMFTPDIWDTTYQDSPVVSMDIGLLADHRDIWFRAVVGIPDTTHVTGDFKWNWDKTWYKYAFDVSNIDESASIDITTSPDIRLTAQFRFAADGSGTTDDNWAKFDQTIFVKFEFFAEPDSNGYDGYYTLLSEDWKVKHYFKLNRYES